ncbi:hypothetical protein LSH36_186g02040 [Paralvinella palmiformis]|uniref:Uncharacterized protein n=1 Tax=Paralvinella palmiformis TaxID=53620 RepID=A0AAD9N5D9_9ANNE|nr:hypothetical protein LSH36_186g02040 [Paralvinella palmiformis]
MTRLHRDREGYVILVPPEEVLAAVQKRSCLRGKFSPELPRDNLGTPGGSSEKKFPPCCGRIQNNLTNIVNQRCRYRDRHKVDKTWRIQPILDNIITHQEVNKMTWYVRVVAVPFMLSLIALQLSLPIIEARSSIGLGIAGALGGLGKQNSDEPHIRVKLPGGEVREYIWGSVKPFIWHYVCRLCAHLPDRCHGDTNFCGTMVCIVRR